jgi:hypothetical protein
VEPPVAAAVISSSVALVIAVVGVIATGVAQSRATTKAHSHALELFDRQEAAQQRAREAEAAERVRLAHLVDRRNLYLRLPILLVKYADAVHEADVASREVDEAEAAGRERLRELIGHAGDASAAVVVVLDEMIEAVETLQIMAPQPITDVALAWMDAARESGPRAHELQREYLRLVRADLGVEPTGSDLSP